jgi:hypothetical protein
MIKLERRIPKLLDYVPFSQCLARIADLEGKLAAARTELKTLRYSRKGIDARHRARTESVLNVRQLEQLLATEHLRIPELRREAEELVVSAACKARDEVTQRVLRMRGHMSRALQADIVIRAVLRDELSSTLPGSHGIDLGERFVRPLAKVTSGAISL